MPGGNYIARHDDLVLVTGASGFIGERVVAALREQGFHRIRCLVRPSSELPQPAVSPTALDTGPGVEYFRGNLLSPADCAAALHGVAVVYHLATARDSKSYPEAFLNTVVTTRNLLEAARESTTLKRFVSISSFAVYTNRDKPGGRLLDERCPIETHPVQRGDAYCFAKVKQDELVEEYGRRFGVPYVIVRPGYVLGPTKGGISSRVGIDTFGFFLHLGGSNTIPFTYVDNCADAIVLAGLVPGVEREVINVVDDDLPTSRGFLRRYKRDVRRFRSIYVPHVLSYALCHAWERYCAWSEGQLPPTFNRPHWHAFWKKTRYSNAKAKRLLGWSPRVPMEDALKACLGSYRDERRHA